MFKLAVFLCVIALVAAFAPTRVQKSTRYIINYKIKCYCDKNIHLFFNYYLRTEISMTSDFQKAFSATLIGASLFLGQSARAEIDYDGVKYLGGGDKVDLNNANIRAYVKIPGLYPNIASKIVNNGPFKSVSEVYNIPGLTNAEKEILKKTESRFVTLDSKPEYVIDKINNG